MENQENNLIEESLVQRNLSFKNKKQKTKNAVQQSQHWRKEEIDAQARGSKFSARIEGYAIPCTWCPTHPRLVLSVLGTLHILFSASI